tara:strand:- start:224 stop:397 length:174 start_codon:yes stop_codon:yes gene_type:complete
MYKLIVEYNKTVKLQTVSRCKIVTLGSKLNLTNAHITKAIEDVEGVEITIVHITEIK